MKEEVKWAPLFALLLVVVTLATGAYVTYVMVGTYKQHVTNSKVALTNSLSLNHLTTNSMAPVIVQTNSTAIMIPRHAAGIEGLLVQTADYAYTIAILGGSRSDMTNAVIGALRGDITASTNWYKSSPQKTP